MILQFLKLKGEKRLKYKKSYFTLLLLLLVLLIFTSLVNARSNSPVTVFIIDTKVDFAFVENLAMDGQINHGSVVGRIIYQEVPEVNLRSCSVEEKGSINEQLYYDALRKIASYNKEHPNERIIVNISLGFSKAEAEHKTLINDLVNRGVIVIAAGGNESSEQAIYPAGFKGTVAVGNATADAKAASSNYGDFIDLCAPGNVKYISRLYLPQGVTVKSFKAVGTSFSAPRVVALLAKLLTLQPNLSAQRGLDLILNNTDVIDDPKYEQGLLGTGVINVDRTLAQVDPYYYFKAYSFLILWGGLFLAVFIYYFKQYKFGGLFLIILLSLVIVPLGLLIQEIVVEMVQQLWANYRQLGVIDYIYIALAPLIILKVTSWQRNIALVSYLFYLVLIALTVNLTAVFSITPSNYLRIMVLLIILVLIVIERMRLYQVRQATTTNELVNLLSSYSDKTVNIAEEKLKNSKSSLSTILKIMHQANITFELIEEIIIGFATRTELIDNLVNILKREDKELEELVIKLLSKLDRREVINKVKVELKATKPQVKYALLRLIAKLKIQDQKIVELVLKILFSNNDMWLRYQALITLVDMSSSLEELKVIINELRFDQAEIIRLEAQNLWSQLEN